MKPQALSSMEFFQLTVNTLLEMCTHSVDGLRIVGLEGHLLLTLDNGNKVNLNIHQQAVGDNSIKPPGHESTDESALNINQMPASSATTKTEPESEDVQCLDTVPSANTPATVNGTDGAELIAASSGYPPCVIAQENGLYECSACGSMMKNTQDIVDHISAHIILKHAELTELPSQDAADNANNTNGNKVKHKGKKKQKTAPLSKLKKLPSGNAQKWHTYSCKCCEDVFISRNDRNLHTEHVHRSYPCQACGLVIIGRLKFSEHVRSEHPGRYIYEAQHSFVCEYCSRPFKFDAELNDHIATVHLGTVEHRCDECGKVLGSAATLKIHQRQLHSTKLIRTCESCGRQFPRLAALIEHQNSAHPHLLPEKYQKRRREQLACGVCGMYLSRPISLRRHMEAVHGGAPKYPCPVCSRRFRCRRYVLRHCHIHHSTTNLSQLRIRAVEDDSSTV